MSNNTLKTPTHTLYGTTPSNPDYDKTNGWARLSSADYMLTAPLPHNYITAGKNYIVSFVYKLAADVGGETSYPIEVYVGLWDNTAGKQQFLGGLPLPLTATIEGATGSTTREYFVVLHTAGGDTIGTQKVTVTNSNATIDTTNYVKLAWSQPRGIIRSEVYRKTGAVYERIGFPYPEQTFFDRGHVSNTVDGYPDVTYDRPAAMVKSTLTNLSPARSDRWQQAQFNVPVPHDYAVSAGAGKQWFVLGLQSDIVGSSSDRALFVDLLSVDDKFGIFTRNPLDFLAKRQLSITPVGGDQEPNPGPIHEGGVDTGCPVFDALIDTDHGKIKAIDLVDNEHIYRIIDRNGTPSRYLAAITPNQKICTILAGSEGLTGSVYHRMFTDHADTQGTWLHELRVGDNVLHRGDLIPISAIIEHARPRHTVRITLLGPEKGYWHDGFGVHNLFKR